MWAPDTYLNKLQGPPLRLKFIEFESVLGMKQINLKNQLLK